MYGLCAYVISSGFIAQWFKFNWTNLTEVVIDLPIAFQGYYSALSTDVGAARFCYGTNRYTNSQIILYSPQMATNIAARCIAIGY